MASTACHHCGTPHAPHATVCWRCRQPLQAIPPPARPTAPIKGLPPRSPRPSEADVAVRAPSAARPAAQRTTTPDLQMATWVQATEPPPSAMRRSANAGAQPAAAERTTVEREDRTVVQANAGGAATAPPAARTPPTSSVPADAARLAARPPARPVKVVTGTAGPTHPATAARLQAQAAAPARDAPTAAPRAAAVRMGMPPTATVVAPGPLLRRLTPTGPHRAESMHTEATILAAVAVEPPWPGARSAVAATIVGRNALLAAQPTSAGLFVAAAGIDTAIVITAMAMVVLAETALGAGHWPAQGNALEAFALWLHHDAPTALHAASCGILVSLGYTAYGARYGRTLGRALCGLTLRRATGAAPSWRWAAWHAGCSVATTLCFGAGAFWGVVDRHHRTWGNLLSRSAVSSHGAMLHN